MLFWQDTWCIMLWGLFVDSNRQDVGELDGKCTLGRMYGKWIEPFNRFGTVPGD